MLFVSLAVKSGLWMDHSIQTLLTIVSDTSLVAVLWIRKLQWLVREMVVVVPNLQVSNHGEASTSVGASPPICTFYTPEYSGLVEGLKKSVNALGHEFIAIRMPSEG